MGVALCCLPLFGLCVVAGGRAPAGAAREHRPNIIFFYADDHAYQAISAYRDVTPYQLSLNETPNIDRLAREGMRFDNCFVTNSICGPARAVVQTGKYSHLNGFLVNGQLFDGSQQTFPKLLRRAGYQTAVIGKWHLGSHQVPQGYDYSEVLIGQGPYYNPVLLKNGDRFMNVGATTEIISELTLRWLKEQRDPSKPFMLMCQHKAPHRNWEPGPKHLDLYDDITIPEPDTLFDDYSGRGTPAKTQNMTIAHTLNDVDLKFVTPRGLTPEQKQAWEAAYGPKNEAVRKANLKGKELVRWKYQRFMKDYLRCIAAVDECVGRVLDYLDESGLAENTIVIYTSDQGFYLGEHGWFDKRWIYEGSLRTPLLVRWPAVIKPGSVNRDIVSNLDFAETFLDVAGLPIPSDMQGRSLLPLFKGERPSDWRKYFYYHYYEFPGPHDVRRHYGVVDGRFKLVHFYEPDLNEWEMYDLKRDPKELHSVYGQPEYRAEQERLMRALEQLRAELKVPQQDPPATYRGGPKLYKRALERIRLKMQELGL